jgi:putative DNA primase/helicase
VVLEIASPVLLETEALLRSINEAHDRLCAQGTPVRSTRGTPANTDRYETADGVKSYGPPDLAKLASALEVLDPDCDEATWKLNRIAPLARAAAAHFPLADDLRELARSWSSGELRGEPSHAWTTPGATNGLTGKEAFDQEWRRFLRDDSGGQRTTLGTIYYEALQAGWRYAAENFTVVDGPTKVVEVPDAIDAEKLELDRALETVRGVIAACKAGDEGAPFEPNSLAALALLQARDQAEFRRMRGRIKASNPQVSLISLDAAIKAEASSTEGMETHHSYALEALKRLAVGQWRPVAHEGALHVVDPGSNRWIALERGGLEREVAEMNDGRKNCSRQSDYKGIAQHAMSLASDDAFFGDAPVGLACPDGFYRIVDGEVLVEPLTPAHRQRVLVQVAPREQPTPLFDAFLHETFHSEQDGEEAQQIALVQEIAGAIMLGTMYRYQKAVLFYDPFGRAGKGTLESILRGLVPNEFITAVSPFAWHREYFVVTLAGARLNVVGELPDNDSLPAAIFKSVIGLDLITGRNPTHSPITFRNGAAHLFMSNHMINSRDMSEAFFSRWQMVEFPNSRLRSGLPLDPGLADRIVERELPGIAHWALQGGIRVLQNNGFSASMAHDRLLQKWRRSNSSLDEFIHECCELRPEQHVRRAHLYKAYEAWCKENGRKPFGKSKVKDLLAHNVGLNITAASLNGNDIFRGVCFKESAEVAQGSPLDDFDEIEF